MASLTNIRARAAAYLQCTVADFTVDGTDLFLPAVNQVRRLAEMNWDFEFSWARFSLSVDTVTGASLDSAVLVSGATAGSKIKTVIDVYQTDTTDNLIPIEWTTMQESAQRQRRTNPGVSVRYPTDADTLGAPSGRARIIFDGSRVFIWPIAETSETFTIYIDAFTTHPGWTSLTQETSVVNGSGATLTYTEFNGDYESIGTFNSKDVYARFSGTELAFIVHEGTFWFTTTTAPFSALPANYWKLTTTDTPAGTYTAVGAPTGTFVVTGGDTQTPWLTHAEQYLLWGVIVDLNFLRKEFVPRTEGNLGPPTVMRDEALETFKQWDTAKFEQRRRHGKI